MDVLAEICYVLGSIQSITTRPSGYWVLAGSPSRADTMPKRAGTFKGPFCPRHVTTSRVNSKERPAACLRVIIAQHVTTSERSKKNGLHSIAQGKL